VIRNAQKRVSWAVHLVKKTKTEKTQTKGTKLGKDIRANQDEEIHRLENKT